MSQFFKALERAERERQEAAANDGPSPAPVEGEPQADTSASASPVPVAATAVAPPPVAPYRPAAPAAKGAPEPPPRPVAPAAKVAPQPAPPRPVAPAVKAPPEPAPARPVTPVAKAAPEPTPSRPVAPAAKAAPEPVPPQPVPPAVKAAPEPAPAQPVAPAAKGAPEPVPPRPVAPAAKAAPEPVLPRVVAELPSVEASARAAQRAAEAFERAARKAPKSRNPLRSRDGAPVLVADLEPESVASEAYRALRVNIEFMPHAEKCRNIVVTSPSQGEGKSTTAANLAIVSAQAGWRVCLIDADFRRPVIHAAFGLPNRGGLVKALSEKRPLSTVAMPSGFPGLSVVVAGEYDLGQTDLFSSDRIQHVRQDSETHYDLVIWDTPPIILVADAINVVAQCDGVILVVRSGAIPSSVLRRASRQITQVNGKILGVLLNGVDPRRTDQEFYRYYHAYQESNTQP